MMSLTFGLFNQVSGLGPLGPLVSTNKRAMTALGRSPEYHWNQIISKSVHRFSRRSRLKLFLFIALGTILFNRAEPFEQFL